ncbi:hypothetical protein VPH35_004178 [Triticum aestivum]
MAARSWLLLLLGLAGVLRVHGQRAPDSTGELHLYLDAATKLPYVPDDAFTDAGSNRNISPEYIKPSSSKRYLNVRSKYLLRSTFMYGNYDGLGRLPVFDLHLGVNFWRTVNVTTADKPQLAEIIAVVPDESVQVCLVDTGSGTPFISALDLMPVRDTLYPQANATQALVLVDRTNFGLSGATLVRYPEDPYDRVWIPWSEIDSNEWTEISTPEKVKELADPRFNAPSAVMQTAITPRNGSRSASSRTIELSWDAAPNHAYPDPGVIGIVYFAELEAVAAARQFEMAINGKLWSKAPFTPQHLVCDAFFNSEAHRGFGGHYNITLNATVNSTLLPTINAAEFFSVVSTANVATDAKDVAAMAAIKAKYEVKKNWAGDPCAPKTLVWDGLNCSYAISMPPRITRLNMSFGALSGGIPTHFANLKSYNNFTGPIPNVLSELPFLVVLDLTGNKLNGSIPSGYGKNPNLCSNGGSCEPTKKNSKSMLAVYIAAPILAVVVIGALAVLLLLIMRKKQVACIRSRGMATCTACCSWTTAGSRTKDLQVMTNYFKTVLGRGGFGSVYDGFLPDGTQVAVKLRSESSRQGVREFLTKARTLTKIHHKNLVSMVGYCKDGEYMALVYEHMSEGNLEDKLRGKDSNSTSLTWRQRLRIAMESAQGLEYLHVACSPAFVHRDVKTLNILLNVNLEAKVADFGLLKAFKDGDTHVSTARLVGTHGYLAPEYTAALQLTEKSDVYSFGVVLLEVIMGRPPILQCPEPTNIIQWKVTDVALKCTVQAPTQRPTMTEVVAQLQECLKLEEHHMI